MSSFRVTFKRDARPGKRGEYPMLSAWVTPRDDMTAADLAMRAVHSVGLTSADVTDGQWSNIVRQCRQGLARMMS
ncbi:MAG: hypothetical protein ACI9MR_000029 [Myxococcota bacterium]|jgi:hypothetical protein